MEHLFIRNEREERLYNLAAELANTFKKNAQQYDASGEFPFDHFNDLKSSGYSSLTIPEEYGGENITLTEMVLVQERLAQGDAATALGIGWHLGVLLDLRTRREWPEAKFKALAGQVVDEKKIINRAMTEPKTGSPTRGGRPQTTAKRTTDGWVLDGHKTFTTLAPAADIFIINTAIENSEEVGGFLVAREVEGVTVETTWNTLGMRATRSDDLYLNNVKIPLDAYVETIGGDQKKDNLPPAWLLHIPACYLGIALAAQKDVIQFAKTYQPNSLDHPISEVPHVRDKIGQIELELLNARHMLYGVARQWDDRPEQRQNFGQSLAAAKVIAVRAAEKTIDLAMRIVGGTSIFKSLPFERYYRDVRAGLFNPPTEDAVLAMLAAAAFSHE